MNSNLITKAIEICGLQPLARACGVSYQALRKWEKYGLPRTEWTMETDYSKTIEQLTQKAVTREQLLAKRHANKRRDAANSPTLKDEPHAAPR